MIVTLDAATAAHGGKAAALGELSRAGLPVPEGFVVPADVDAADLTAVVATALARLGGVGEHPPVAVRSSAADEDGTTASAAGQYDSVLGVIGPDAVVAAVRACRASATAPRVIAYRAAIGNAGPVAGAPSITVVVQRLVDARAAGVLFTGSDGCAVIEASWGLGESVVQGAVGPDRFTVVGDRITDRHVGSKHFRVDRSPASAHGGTHTRDVAAADRGRSCLDDATVLRVAALGERVAALRGGPQDVEWAVDDDGGLWLLQARPVTAALPGTPRTRAPGAAGVLRGVAGSSGRASGPVRVVRGPDDFAVVRPGDVLACRETDPAWTPLFGVVAAVVTETGGLLSHAAIVARELGLPAVLGVPGVTDALHDAGTVAVDGDAGTVEIAPSTVATRHDAAWTPPPGGGNIRP